MKKIAYNVAGLALPIAIIVGLFLIFIGLFLKLPPVADPIIIYADTATTSVTVLNTPPNWTVDALESPGSNTSTPTDVGSAVTWRGTGTDDNGERYYLLICKTSSTPTANANAAPTCGGGSGNQWTASASTTSGGEAAATYAATSSDAESNDWYAWICDGNASNPACNSQFKQGTGTGTSPFVVNHRPSFTVIGNDSPKDPGSAVLWTATSSDSDTLGGSDQVRLWICQANDFDTALNTCGVGGSYCSSTLAASAPSCSSTFAAPRQDGTFNAYAFMIDNHGFEASGGAHASNSPYTISNVSPTISSSTIELLDTDGSGDLTLSVPGGQTTGFKVRAVISDNNSCDALGGGSADEISSLLVNVYRSGIGPAGCDASSEYNPNFCYPGTLPTSTWNATYAASSTSCSGSSDDTIIWEATFPFWFLADPTDGTTTNTQFSTHTWMASVQATDDDSATSTFTEDADGNELDRFLGWDVIETSISYGSLRPGSSTNPIVATTTLQALGNVGLDENLDGEDMCATFSGPDTCPVSTTSTIPVGEQAYGSSSISYGSATPLTSSSAEFELNVSKSTATSSPATKPTNWGIRIPSSITLAGDYTGRNQVVAVVGEPGAW